MAHSKGKEFKKAGKNSKVSKSLEYQSNPKDFLQSNKENLGFKNSTTFTEAHENEISDLNQFNNLYQYSNALLFEIECQYKIFICAYLMNLFFHLDYLNHLNQSYL